ncbi:MAG: hypothetical protein KDK66_09325 [Deltaproteobacteria bacterium]|nr:hypothetical protein [Deltaproteobacteria bacterium]
MKKISLSKICKKLAYCHLDLEAMEEEITSYGILFRSLDYTGVEAAGLAGIGINLAKIGGRLEKINHQVRKLNYQLEELS